MSTQAADLVLYNANIVTMARGQPRAELVAVEGGKIVWVGLDKDIDLFRGRAKVINCEGKTIIPGFNDAHIHVIAYASRLLSVDCSPASVASISDIQHRIRQESERVPQGTWIKATGYNEFYLAEHRHPTRHELDQAAPGHPVKLTHRSLHACVLNSMGLSLAGIAIDTPEPPGGLIDRELETGEPSGLLFGMNAFLSEQVVPPLSQDELSRGIELANRSLLMSGITSVQDATVSNGIKQWQTFLRLKEKGKLVPRVGMMFGLDALDGLREQGLHPLYGDYVLRLGPVKITLDEVRGRLNPSKEQLNEGVLRAHREGYQVAIHAVEESTVEAAASALEYCLQGAPKADHRHRVEHCSVCPPELLKRLRDVNAVVVTQPAFIYYNGERYLEEVPDTQLPWLYRTRAFLESGLGPAASSDCPVIPCDPLVGIYAAVTRQAESGRVLSPEEAISPEEALAMCTLGGANASFEENVKGSVEVGKLADLVVLSADPTGVAPDEITEIQVEKTVMGGEVVWEQ